MWKNGVYFFHDFGGHLPVLFLEFSLYKSLHPSIINTECFKYRYCRQINYMKVVICPFVHPDAYENVVAKLH